MTTQLMMAIPLVSFNFLTPTAGDDNDVGKQPIMVLFRPRPRPQASSTAAVTTDDTDYAN